MTTEGFADADGVPIHWIDHGGDGRDLLLVHATGFHGRVWDPMVPVLRERFRVVAIDQRGHGESGKPAEGYRWQAFADDIFAVAGALELDHPAAVGHSAGAAAILLAATQRPDVFWKVVLLDPVVPPPALRPYFTSPGNPLAEGARKRRRVWDSRAQMIARLGADTALAGWRPEFLEAYVEHGTRPTEDGRFELKCPPEIEAQVYENAGRHDGWERLADLPVPVLLAGGERSEMWGRSGGFASSLPPGAVRTVPGGGHFFPMEVPEPTLEMILGFLSD